jgi:hypothetical protein
MTEAQRHDEMLARANADLTQARLYGDAVWIEAAEKELAAVNAIMAMAGATPEGGTQRFAAGDRCFSHYTMRWGTIEKVETIEPHTTWYMVVADDGHRDMLDDAHGNWTMARVVPPSVATRYGYGTDPRG